MLPVLLCRPDVPGSKSAQAVQEMQSRNALEMQMQKSRLPLVHAVEALSAVTAGYAPTMAMVPASDQMQLNGNVVSPTEVNPEIVFSWAWEVLKRE